MTIPGPDAPTPSAPDQEALTRLLSEQAPVVLWAVDKDLRFTSSTGAALRTVGVSPSQLKGLSLYDYFGTRDKTFLPIAQHLRALNGEKSTFGFDWKNRSFHVWVEPFRDENGKVFGVVGLALDITERKRAESALQDSEERWKAVVTQAPDFISIIDKDGRIFYMNHMTKGFTAEEVIGVSTLDFLLPEYRSLAKNAYRRAIETGEIFTYEVQGKGEKVGGPAWYRTRVGPLYRNGKIANLILISTDISETKRSEADLQNSFDRMRQLTARLQSAREEERRRISLDIHDRLGQSLTGLKLGLSSLVSRLGKDAEIKRRAKDLFSALDETIQTVREISTELRPAILDSLGLRAAIEWQARKFQKTTGLVCRLDLPPRDIPLERERSAAMFRIFQEILTNVARHSKAKRVEVALKRYPRKLTLTVRDDGRGISRKALQDPSSLGLMGMHERALSFGGTVDIQGRTGRGTTVAVAVPLGKRRRKP